VGDSVVVSLVGEPISVLSFIDMPPVLVYSASQPPENQPPE
jgi:hypothetical protein